MIDNYIHILAIHFNLIQVVINYIIEISSVYYDNATSHDFIPVCHTMYIVIGFLQNNHLIYTCTYISLISMTNKSVLTFLYVDKIFVCLYVKLQPRHTCSIFPWLVSRDCLSLEPGRIEYSNQLFLSMWSSWGCV